MMLSSTPEAHEPLKISRDQGMNAIPIHGFKLHE
jgi:hypothetical protein